MQRSSRLWHLGVVGQDRLDCSRTAKMWGRLKAKVIFPNIILIVTGISSKNTQTFFFYIYSNKCIDILTKSNALHFIIAACWLWRERRKNKIPETNAHDHFTTNTKSKCAFSTRRERELCARPRCRTAMSARDVICRICTHLTHPKKKTPQTYMLYFILCKHGIYIYEHELTSFGIRQRCVVISQQCVHVVYRYI